MTAKAFLEQYMDCMDALPLELQRFASQYWEIDNRNKDLMIEAERIDSASVAVLDGDASTRDKRKWLIQLQRLLISMMEVGSEKLDVTSQMLDTVEGYSQQLALAEKEMVSCRTREELTGGSTRNGGSSTTSTHSSSSSKTVTQASLPALLEVVEKKKSERSQKRARTHDKVEEHDSVPSNGTKEARRDSNPAATATINAGSTSMNVLQSPASASTTNTTSNKSIKKKVKAKKKSCVVKEQTQAIPTHPVATVPAAVPTPDFTTEPIDPDEPTYCLCNQVSFGEMIGCDNEDCSIEWFHFQCVGLTAKPKGKWYCPRCHSERAKHRSGKT